MIKHVVCFRLADRSESSVLKARDILLSMDGKVPQIRKISVGVDFLHSPRSYDLILEVTLDGREALEPYQNDTYHVNTVKAYMHKAAEASISLDCDL